MFGDQLKILGGGVSSMFHAMWAMLLLAARCGIRYFAMTSLIDSHVRPPSAQQDSRLSSVSVQPCDLDRLLSGASRCSD